MSIFKVNNSLPRQNQINSLNDMILENEGNIAQGEFNKNELDQLYTDIGLNRKFLREQSLGHTTSNYTEWSHLKTEDGYSIWKLTPGSYAYNSVNQLYFNDLALDNRGEASSESAISFDSVFFYDGDSGGGYTDNTTEAGTEGGTQFSINNSTTDYLYIGDDATFTGFKVEWQTRGSNYTLVVEYYDGSSWTTMTANTNTLSDNTSNFESDGYMTWVAPGDWATTTVNSATRYWIRVSTSATPVTAAKAYYIIPYNSVISLLAMSSTQIQNEDWAWCSYTSAIYVTIRNTGNSSYEGNYFITSSSSVANLQNFFVHNHHYKLDFENSLYSSANISTFIDDVFMPFSHSGWTATNIHAAILEAQSGETNTASNTGSSGTGLFKQKSTYDLEFYKIVSANDRLTFVLDGTDKIDITLVEGNIDHDALTNYDSNDHIDHTTITLTAGDGLDGTGDISANRTFSLDLKANGGCVIESTELAVDLGAASITGTLVIGDGGSGQTTQQAAIDALSAVSGATNEYILTKDTGTGNAVWKANSGGGAPIDASFVTLSLNASLTNENVLTAGNGIDINTISGSTVTIDVDESELDSYLLPFSFSGYTADNVHDAIVEAGLALAALYPDTIVAAETITFDVEYDNGNSGASETIVWGNGNKQKSILTDDCTYTFTNPSGVGNFLLKMVQDNTGNRSPTFPYYVKWPGGITPSWSTGGDDIDVIAFYFDGTNYYAQGVTNFS